MDGRTTKPTAVSERERSNAPAPASLKEYMTLEALAEAFGVSRGVACRWRDELGMPHVRLDARRTIVHEPTVAAWLKTLERTVKPAE